MLHVKEEGRGNTQEERARKSLTHLHILLCLLERPLKVKGEGAVFLILIVSLMCFTIEISQMDQLIELSSTR